MGNSAISSDPAVTKGRAALGAIFLTVFIDLVGFSIIFPLFPAMLGHYFPPEGGEGWLASFVETLHSLAGARGVGAYVLFGGILGSLYSLLQFVASPFWGRLSDRLGRRRVMLFTIGGTCVAYALWAVSGQFWLLVVSRVVGGLMAGNISVATAAIADVTTEKNRSKGMALIGIAFGLGFILGPAIGGFSVLIDLSSIFPNGQRFGLNPFTLPALIALGLSLINLWWVYAKLEETLPQGKRATGKVVLNPFARLKGARDWRSRRVLVINFLFLLVFSGMEFTLTFLALERLNYKPEDNALMFVFIGLVLMLVQGYFVRKYANRIGEKRLTAAGIVTGMAGLCALAFAPMSPLFYLGLFLMATGIGLISPTLTSLISLYTEESRQGAALGAFRAAGALARAVGPLLWATSYWATGSVKTYLVASAVLLVPLAMSLTLPQPKTSGKDSQEG